MDERQMFVLLNTVYKEFDDINCMIKLPQNLRNTKNPEHWQAKQDIMMMYELFKDVYLALLQEAAVCKQRKKITEQFCKNYDKFKSCKENLVGNITMYSLMYA
jgi:hypothetical protein